MKAKPAAGYAKFESRTLQQLLRSPFVAVAMHWAFQSMFYMDATERRFKLALDAILTCLFGALLAVRLPWPVAWSSAFLAAHTLNFLFNGQLWGALKHYGMISRSYEEFDGYVRRLAARARREPSIARLAVYGSLSRAQWSPSSDLDARILRRPGFMNGVRACWFVLCERSRAISARFPLDMYVVDSDVSLRKLAADECVNARDLL